MKRNLIYHVAPLDNPMLDFNLGMLARFLDVFNHKRIINVAQGENLLPLDAFLDRARRSGLKTEQIEFTASENHPVHRETAAFADVLLPRVQSLDPTEITFFAHAKGISNPSSVESKKWAEYMYRYNLSNLDKVERALLKYACAGIFKLVQPFTQVQLPWHYSGTFFWFNNAKLFSKDWKNIEMSRYGTESYLPRLFESKEAYCLAFQLWYPYLNLYDADIWAKIEKSHGELYPFRWLGPVSAWINRFLHKRRRGAR
jgi:hypothetical protein